MAVPLAISDASSVSSQRRTGNESVMMELLNSGTARPRVNPIAGKSTLIVDGQVLVMALGRPSDCNAFEDLGDKFDNLLGGEAPNNKIVIVGGGFEEEDAVKCSRSNIDIRALKGFQE